MSLSPLEKTVIERFAAWLRARFGQRLSGITLFGSRARSEGHAESDLDLLVLVRGVTRDERGEILDETWSIEQDAGIPISPLVRDPTTWNPTTPLARTIEEEGAPL